MLKILLMFFFFTTLTVTGSSHPFRRPPPPPHKDNHFEELFPDRYPQETSPWSEMVVVKMHYDCSGRLMEIAESKLITRTDQDGNLEFEDVPNLKIRPEKQISAGINWRSKSFDLPKILKGTERQRIFETGKVLGKDKVLLYKSKMADETKKRASVLKIAEASTNNFNYHSMKERLRKDFETSTRPSLGAGKPEGFDPDVIIGSPFMSCPEGQNNDPSGNCREVFP